MSISELTEGPDDPLSRLVNMAFQLIHDGEPTHIARIRRDLCVQAGYSHASCEVVWQTALYVGETYTVGDASRRFHYAADTARDICLLFA
ncbi:hypothetical protein H8Z72_23435 (plasmid) [Xanthomonas citri pv. citri]|uniref:hypothetical protein n=1 Tax=Xanthomonas citri TaxID=346 RepID=UPI001934A6F1|nr:hypothetical protein [Xanthomonas citri]QRD62732.1 hypothetical protein H8Z74_22750 [Xanthomonas citri pv. citri]QRD67059.1 hypothetical protein H8Z73_22835 [Xanthomonas citri pv. citri]QRD71688.1 hypothetical protein H8Z72_23435 [Xanthomonas citri pv. citri]